MVEQKAPGIHLPICQAESNNFGTLKSIQKFATSQGNLGQ